MVPWLDCNFVCIVNILKGSGYERSHFLFFNFKSPVLFETESILFLHLDLDLDLDVHFILILGLQYGSSYRCHWDLSFHVSNCRTDNVSIMI